MLKALMHGDVRPGAGTEGVVPFFGESSDEGLVGDTDGTA